MKSLMTLFLLDQYFPFIVFFYGFLLVFVLEAKWLKSALKSAQGQQILSTLCARKGFAYVCFYVGGIWSVQNLLFT